VLGMKRVTQTGSILNISLVSSTWVTGHSFHGLVEPSSVAALSKNLQGR